MAQFLGAFKQQLRQPRPRLTAEASALLESAENALFSNVKTPMERSLVEVNGLRVHTLYAAGANPRATPLVMTHGYAAGSAFWFRNVDYLAQFQPVYMVDWPGHGRSSEFSRSCFGGKEDAESFFVESLENWRQSVLGKEQKMHLNGHSMGGYLSAVYAMKYGSSSLESLVLTSPVGIPREDPSFWTNLAERRQGGGAVSRALTKSLLYLVRGLWSAGVSPQMIMRAVGEERGARVMGRYAGARFTSISDEHRKAIGEYLFHLSNTRTSIEAAMPVLLNPGAWAKDPLCDRMPDDCDVPVMFLYGEHDWMPIDAAMKMAPHLRSRSKIAMVSHGGHFLFMENPWQYNSSVQEWLSGGYSGSMDGKQDESAA